MPARQIFVEYGPPIKVAGRGRTVSITQGGCHVIFGHDDVLALFDAVAGAKADNDAFTEKHRQARHPANRGAKNA